MDDALKDLLTRQLREVKLDLSHDHPDVADVWPVVAKAYQVGVADGFRRGKSAQGESDKARFTLCAKCRGCDACARHYRGH